MFSSYSAFDHDHDILVESRSWILHVVSEPRGSQSRIVQGCSRLDRDFSTANVRDFPQTLNYEDDDERVDY
ncbi:hypothetical protein Tco_0567653 [Tanacetum coccineum]